MQFGCSHEHNCSCDKLLDIFSPVWYIVPMSLYNLTFGVHERSNEILSILSLKQIDIDRFRDVCISEIDDQLLICICARIGGSYRPHHEECINKLRNHSLFVKEHDVDYDKTFVYFYFKVPAKDLPLIKSIGPSIDPVRRFAKLIKIGDVPAYQNHPDVVRSHRVGKHIALRIDEIKQKHNHATIRLVDADAHAAYKFPKNVDLHGVIEL